MALVTTDATHLFLDVTNRRQKRRRRSVSTYTTGIPFLFLISNVIIIIISLLSFRSGSSSGVVSAFLSHTNPVTTSSFGNICLGGRRASLFGTSFLSPRFIHRRRRDEGAGGNIRKLSFFSSSSSSNMSSSSSSSSTTSPPTSSSSPPKPPLLTTSDRIQTTFDPCVILMKNLISKHSHLWTNKNGIYSLAQGVVYWDPPPTIQNAISTALTSNDADLHKYCPDEGLPQLLSALKIKVARENALHDVNIMVTSGANQAYMNCILSLLPERQTTKCIIFEPYYFNHIMAIQMTRGTDALLIGPTNDDGIPDINWLRDILSSKDTNDVKVVTLVNPGNPTGVSLSKSTIQRIVDVTKEFGVWLIMDNTYEHFDHSNVNAFEFTTTSDDEEKKKNSMIKGFHCWDETHVINIFSFSKGYGMAGYRVGYVTVSDKDEVGKDAYRQMLKVQDTIPICTTRISQVAALGALTVGRQWVLDQVDTLQHGRNAILNAMKPLQSIMGGSGAMYVMGKLPDGMDDQEVANKLVEQYGVAVIPGSFCGHPGWIRVCYSNLPPDECKVAAKRLADGIRDLCG